MNNYYSGQGSLYVAKRNSLTGKPEGFLAVGNVPELTINIETTKFEHKESESGARLIDLTLITEKKGLFEFTLENLSLDNLALGLWGTKATVAGGTIAAGAEEIVIPMGSTAGMRFPLAHPNVTALTVTGPGGTPTHALGTDYEVDAKNGVIIIKGGIVTGAASAASSIEVGYTYAGYVKMDAFTDSTPPERWLRFEGLNTVDGKSVIIDMFKAQFEPLTGYALINEELGSVSMKGNVLADALQTVGSQFFRQVNAG